MKPTRIRPALKRLTLMFLLTGLPAYGQLVLTSNWNGDQAITDNDPSGVAFPFTLSDPAFTTIGNVSVSLNLSGGYNGDLYAYLSHGSGISVLLNRVGRVDQNEDGYGNPGFAVTFSGKVSLDIHEYQSLSPTYNGGGQLTGVWAADGRNLDPATAAPTFNAAPRDATLSSFTGTDPNGSWTLFLADLSSGGISTLNSWSIEVTAVPEPARTGLAISIILGLTAMARRRGVTGSLH